MLKGRHIRETLKHIPEMSLKARQRYADIANKAEENKKKREALKALQIHNKISNLLRKKIINDNKKDIFKKEIKNDTLILYLLLVCFIIAFYTFS